ncbi:MAG: mechanosensitive ion channel family protein [Rhizonema sp. PD37]|nr:mechanosensitive ion channel family protein [Rhizonema sp. PD37]
MLQIILPPLFIIISLLAGVLFDKVIFKRIKKFANSKKIPGTTILFKSLDSIPVLLFFMAGVYAALLSYPFKPVVANVLEKIIVIVFLSSMTLVFARLTAGFVTVYSYRKTESVSASLISNLAKTVVLVLGILILLETVGIQITPILTTLGVGGIAVGLALQDTLANLFSGFYLIISKQIRTGDYVKVDGEHEGYITDITWRNTTIKELSNNVIVVPNSKLSSAIFTNYHLPIKEITLTIDVGVDYNSDLEQVERVTVEVAKEVMQEVSPGLLNNEPFIRFQKFGEFSIDFTVYIRLNEFFDIRIARHIFIKKLHKRYKLEGINIPFPTREVYVQGGSNSGVFEVE